MMLEEFESRTGFYPTHDLYSRIEAAYMESGLDKDDFCAAYKENRDGIAEAIAREAAFDKIATAARMENEIKKLQDQVAHLTKQLDRELEWKPYELSDNVPQADYERLAAGAESGRCAHYMTDEEAIRWICDEFDFDPAKVTIIHEVPEYEINRHSQLRKTGKMYDRRPVYCATDYHYIRFNTKRWFYEVWNGQLRPFYA